MDRDEWGRGGLPEHISTILPRALRNLWRECVDKRQERKRAESVGTHDDSGPNVDLVQLSDVAALTATSISIVAHLALFDHAFPPFRTDRRGVRWYRWPDIDAYAVGDAEWTSRTKNPDGSARGLSPLPDIPVTARGT